MELSTRVTDFQDTGYIREISYLKGRFNSTKMYHGLCSFLFDLKVPHQAA
jgi:hypothetical protein